jgi:type IV pilus assembly protein PilC
MLSAGMPLVQSLGAMEEQTSNKNFKPVVAGIRARVEGGAMYSEALAYYPSIFDELYISMMRAGEVGGIMPETCGRVASFLESSNRLRSKVKSSMMYPSIVMCVAFALATLLIMFVVPIFADMFGGFGAELPAMTQGHLCILKFPILGKLATKIAVSRFASTFSQLLHSGVQIMESLEIVGLATGNRVIGDSLIKARKAIEEGQPLSSVLEPNPYYPRMLVHMLAAGEKTGQVEEMMDKVSSFYDNEVETSLAGLTSMIEPLLMVFVGIVIGTIVIAMFLPIFKMSEVVM